MTIPFIFKVVTLKIIFIKQDRLDGNSLVLIKYATAQVVDKLPVAHNSTIGKTNQWSNTRQNEVVVTTNLDVRGWKQWNTSSDKATAVIDELYCSTVRYINYFHCKMSWSLFIIVCCLSSVLKSICLSFVAYEYVLWCHIFRTIYHIEISSCIDITFGLQLYGPVYG